MNSNNDTVVAILKFNQTINAKAIHDFIVDNVILLILFDIIDIIELSELEHRFNMNNFEEIESIYFIKRELIKDELQKYQY